MNQGQFGLWILPTALLAGVAWAFAAAQAAGTGPELKLTRVTEKIYVIYGPFELPDEHNRGFRNNPVVVLTGTGMVVFDPGGSAWAGESVVRAIESITSDPVVAVFDSHAHGDHWLGNEGVRRAYPQAVIYGHPTMKARVEGPEGERWLDQIAQLTKGTADGRKVVGPDRVVNDGDVIQIGNTQFRIYHFGQAHTDNDIMIEVVGEDALFTGDVVRNGLLGIMESDASFAGNIAAIDAVVDKGFKYYIPGHGRVGGVEVAVAYRGYLDTLLRSVRRLYADQLADYEMKPAVSEAVSAYRDWVGFDLRLGAHVSRAYLEVEAEEF
jgi:glyoxylase-like metal-dependent hydrolase (beta-lactamase superfamily II)